ncbi:hypothetical protein D5W64_12100 [Salmonella enterica subsp. enterica serovar Saintpaul]|nr:hypothetical protein [Salmonella enterica subsp. enterica serovar Saintpaul]
MNMSFIILSVLVVLIGLCISKVITYKAKMRETKVINSIKKKIEEFIMASDNLGLLKDTTVSYQDAIKEIAEKESKGHKVRLGFMDRGCFMEVIMTSPHVTSSFYYVPFYIPSLKAEKMPEPKSNHRSDLNEHVRHAHEFAVMMAAHRQLLNNASLTRADLDGIVTEVTKIYGDVVDICVFNFGPARGKIRITDRDNIDHTVEQLLPCLN